MSLMHKPIVKNIIEQLRKEAVLDLYSKEVKDKKNWATWYANIDNYFSIKEPTSEKLLSLGDHLSEVFKATKSSKVRTQSTLSSRGTNWERLRLLLYLKCHKCDKLSLSMATVSLSYSTPKPQTVKYNCPFNSMHGFLLTHQNIMNRCVMVCVGTRKANFSLLSLRPMFLRCPIPQTRGARLAGRS